MTTMKICLLMLILLCSGCQLGQTVMVSKGEVGGLSELISGEADYCKLTTTEGVVMSPAAQEAFIAYCADVE